MEVGQTLALMRRGRGRGFISTGGRGQGGREGLG